LLVFPWLMGAWGFAAVFNVFGAARREADFYRGRGYWYPILDGEERGTHRLAGACLIAFALASTWVLASQGML